MTTKARTIVLWFAWIFSQNSKWFLNKGTRLYIGGVASLVENPCVWGYRKIWHWSLNIPQIDNNYSQNIWPCIVLAFDASHTSWKYDKWFGSNENYPHLWIVNNNIILLASLAFFSLPFAPLRHSRPNMKRKPSKNYVIYWIVPEKLAITLFYYVFFLLLSFTKITT